MVLHSFTLVKLHLQQSDLECSVSQDKEEKQYRVPLSPASSSTVCPGSIKRNLTFRQARFCLQRLTNSSLNSYIDILLLSPFMQTLMNARRSQVCAKVETASIQLVHMSASALLVTSRVRQPRDVKVRTGACLHLVTQQETQFSVQFIPGDYNHFLSSNPNSVNDIVGYYLHRYQIIKICTFKHQYFCGYSGHRKQLVKVVCNQLPCLNCY